MTTEQYRTGDTITVKDWTGPVPEGKRFLGWNTKADGTGVFVKPGKVLRVYNDMTLFPVWRDVE